MPIMSESKHPEFQLADEIIYFNHAAVAPWPERTRLAVAQFALQNVRYGARDYPEWLQKESLLRKQLQTLINAPSAQDIALVKNTSEAISFVAYGLDWQAGDNIVTSMEEFPSNRIPWESLSNQGVELRQANLQNEAIPEDALLAQVDNRTRLLTISSVQFASGLRLDLNRLGTFCKQNHILFCVDAIQSLGAIQFDVQACQADFVMADGHKWMLGPEGLGVFYSTPEARNRLQLKQFGWHMMKDIHHYENHPWEIHPTARRFECGSPNMLGIHALSASLSLLLELGMETVAQRVSDNTQYLNEKIMASDKLILMSRADKKSASGIVCLQHKTINTPELFYLLQKHNIICACRGSNLRLSPHFYNTRNEIDNVIKIIEQLAIHPS